jgi:hypothetical protein
MRDRGKHYWTGAAVIVAFICGSLLLLLAVDTGTREGAYDPINAHNLLEISRALAAYREKNGRLPRQAVCDASGRPLLSWRVLLLPLLDEEKLYRQFHLNEAWNSSHNQSLIARIPDVYRTASRSRGHEMALAGRTCYLAIAEPGKELGKAGSAASRPFRATDPIVVEADLDCAVVWTKPDDLSAAGGLSSVSSRATGARSGRLIAILANGKVIIAQPVSVWSGKGDARKYFPSESGN